MEIKELCELIGAQTSYDPAQVGKYIESGDLQGGVDPAVDRELVFTLATDSTFFLEVGRSKELTACQHGRGDCQ